MQERDLPTTEEEWRARLDPQQYAVCRCSATEPPFTGKYWDSKADGRYLCAGCGAVLFDSEDKFDSGTGWPSYSRPVDAGAVSAHADESHGMRRVEVLSRSSGIHLGHVFDDGPPPSGKRYCINGNVLKFVPDEARR